MVNTTLQLQTLTCPTCINKITAAVKSLTGVESVEVLFNASKVKVSYDENVSKKPPLQQTIEGLGYEVLNEK